MLFVNYLVPLFTYESFMCYFTQKGNFFNFFGKCHPRDILNGKIMVTVLWRCFFTAIHPSVL